MALIAHVHGAITERVLIGGMDRSDGALSSLAGGIYGDIATTCGCRVIGRH